MTVSKIGIDYPCLNFEHDGNKKGVVVNNPCSMEKGPQDCLTIGTTLCKIKTNLCLAAFFFRSQELNSQSRLSYTHTHDLRGML